LPHLTFQISPGGPLLDNAIGVSHARASALRAAQLSVPQALQIRALVDTGASCTCIDPAILQSLGIPPTGMVPIHTPSTGATAHQAAVYDISLVPMHPALSLPTANVGVAEAHISMQGIQALIGRDIVGRCLVVYDGQSGMFTLAF
jgi:hypothetical protein